MNLITRAYRAIKLINSLPVSKQAAVKIPAGLGLFFFCWLAFDQVEVQNNFEPPFVKDVPFTPPEFALPKSIIGGAQG
jgi:hypothetical protein